MSSQFYADSYYPSAMPRKEKRYLSVLTGKPLIPYSKASGKSTYNRLVGREAMKWVRESVPDATEQQVRNNFSFDFLYLCYEIRHGLLNEGRFGAKDLVHTRMETVKRLTRNCGACAGTVPYRKATYYDNNWYCNACARGSLATCQNCGTGILKSSAGADYVNTGTGRQWMCTACMGQLGTTTNVAERRYKQVVVGKGAGTAVQSSRGFSAEIECYLTDPGLASRRFAGMPSDFGIAHDGSLVSRGTEMPDGRTYQCAVEIQTPVLVGNGGEKYLADLCNALNYKDNAQVDATCGLHVHIDMSDCRNDVGFLKRLMVLHWLFEPVVMSFLPATRRANIYCQSIRNDYNYRRIMAVQTMAGFHKEWYKNFGGLSRYDKKHPRYHGINFHSLLKDGHVEVRYHSGTTNPRKILRWVNLHVLMIDYCLGRRGKVPDLEYLVSQGMTALGKSRTLGVLTENLFGMLGMDPECEKYLRDRQAKFLASKGTTEVEFVEKEPVPGDGKDDRTMQLSLAEYGALINRIIPAK